MPNGAYKCAYQASLLNSIISSTELLLGNRIRNSKGIGMWSDKKKKRDKTRIILSVSSLTLFTKKKIYRETGWDPQAITPPTMVSAALIWYSFGTQRHRGDCLLVFVPHRIWMVFMVFLNLPYTNKLPQSTTHFGYQGPQSLTKPQAFW